MAIKSSNQISVIDLTDAYSVVLTNEAYTFLGDTDSVSSTQTTTTVAQAIQGDEIVPCSVGTITCPTGITAVSDGKSPSPTITITATSALTSGGSIEIPIIIGDLTINKLFSYSIAFTGATGAKGDTGATGKGVKGTPVVTYQVGTSGTSAPTGTWSSSPVATTAQGQYLWTKTVTTYTDNTSTTAYSVAAHGATGAKGATGATGKGIKGTASVTYQVGSSGTSAPTGTWSSSPVATTAAGQYLWTRTITTYTDGTSSTSYSVAAHGTKGDKGDTGSAGKDAIALAITSSAGFIFKNTDISTTLTAHVYKGGVEVTGTALTSLGTIKWYKDSSTTAVGTGTTLAISAGDVDAKASYTAKLEG